MPLPSVMVIQGVINLSFPNTKLIFRGSVSLYDDSSERGEIRTVLSEANLYISSDQDMMVLNGVLFL